MVLSMCCLLIFFIFFLFWTKFCLHSVGKIVVLDSQIFVYICMTEKVQFLLNFMFLLDEFKWPLPMMDPKQQKTKQ